MGEQNSRLSRRFCLSILILVAFALGLFLTPPTSVFHSLQLMTQQGTSIEKVAHAISILKDDSDDIILNRTASAELAWKEQRGYVWIQHARKAGGTSLCMTLRDNTKGLVVANAAKDEYPLERKTCQIVTLCGADCNLKKELRLPPNAKSTSLAPTVKKAMDKAGRNFIEVEGCGVPVDILSDEWSDVVFLSSIRHPMARIESSLRNDGLYKACQRKLRRSPAACLARYIGTNDAILDQCKKSIYFCLSNYFVRMFSGMEQAYTTDADMLKRAKRNFRRFSCVVLQEEWSQTVQCMGERLGLFRHYDSAFNVNGDMRQPVHNASMTSIIGSKSAGRLIRENDYQRLLSLNQVDMQFYAWAKEQIIMQ